MPSLKMQLLITNLSVYNHCTIIHITMMTRYIQKYNS